MVIRVRLWGYAAPSANARDEAKDKQEFVSKATNTADERAPRDGCVDSGLWWGRRRLSSAPGAPTFLHYRERDANGGVRAAGQSVELYRNGFRYEQHGSDLERERSCRRFRASRIDLLEWGLHRPSGFAFRRHGASNGDERRRHYEIGDSDCSGDQRHLYFSYANRCECRARRKTSFSGHNSEPGAPRSHDSLEFERSVLPQCVRNRGWQWELHGAPDSARIRDRECDRHERSRPFQAKLGKHHHYQPLHIAIVRAHEHCCRCEQHAGGAPHAGPWFESQHSVVVVRER
jgi:hypothetical protein